MVAMLRLAAAAGAVTILAACSLGSSTDSETATAKTSAPSVASSSSTALEPASRGAILYTIGLSTDPYVYSAPGGFGVVTGFGTNQQRKAETRSDDLGYFGGADWIDDGWIVVARDAPPFRRQLIFRFEAGRLERVSPSPVPPLEPAQAWSPDGRLVASEPIEPCKKTQAKISSCYRGSASIFVERADGSDRRKVTAGHFDGWTADGRLLVTDPSWNASYRALDTETGAVSFPIPPDRVATLARVPAARVGPARWSADGRYIAAHVDVAWPKTRKIRSAVVLAHADGRPIRFVTSRYIISMFAWSTIGHRLAYTTSGFPDPHELFVVDEPTAKAKRLFATERHFDWVTWSPDSRWIVLDDEHKDLWWLLPTSGARKFRALPRLGGRPLWCCPVNSYATLSG